MKHEDIVVGNLYSVVESLLNPAFISGPIYKRGEYMLLIVDEKGWQGYIRLSTGSYQTWTVGKTLDELKPVK